MLQPSAYLTYYQFMHIPQECYPVVGNIPYKLTMYNADKKSPIPQILNISTIHPTPHVIEQPQFLSSSLL